MRFVLRLLAITQLVFAVRVIARLVHTANGSRIVRHAEPVISGGVTILLPVLNEQARLAPCLEGLIAQGEAVREVIVIDGGSTDGTREIIYDAMRRDPRIRFVDAAPVPEGVNGKAWNLQKGYEHIGSETAWVLTIDADVRPDADLVPSLLAHAEQEHIAAMSVATGQRLSGAAEALLHPAMLATLVYRFGIPGHATTDPAMVQANGQCFLIRRDLLDARRGFSGLQNSVCEDVTLARSLAASGHPVGFYETDRLVSVEMYAGWRDAWDNWTRSLPMRDRYSSLSSKIGLAEVLFVQALPLWITPIALVKYGRNSPLTIMNVILLITRMGILGGIARAYERRPWSYWLSPVTDLPVAIRTIVMARRRQHRWRGRIFTIGASR